MSDIQYIVSTYINTLDDYLDKVNKISSSSGAQNYQIKVNSISEDNNSYNVDMSVYNNENVKLDIYDILFKNKDKFNNILYQLLGSYKHSIGIDVVINNIYVKMTPKLINITLEFQIEIDSLLAIIPEDLINEYILKGSDDYDTIYNFCHTDTRILKFCESKDIYSLAYIYKLLSEYINNGIIMDDNYSDLLRKIKVGPRTKKPVLNNTFINSILNMYIKHSKYEDMIKRKKITPRIYDGYPTIDHLVKIGEKNIRYTNSFIKIKVMYQILAKLTEDNKYITLYNDYENKFIGRGLALHFLVFIPHPFRRTFSDEISKYSSKEYNDELIKISLQLVKDKVELWKHQRK
uniref:Uncharacterized protein n=1 Tax=Pithovirus LCPAC101 TaxID=2506586 RepID=A0A481Z328_9VIRU|nr:MAG: hypothetical protein LCPAC101_00440 [Pithovirus LCPAC101]